MYICDWQGWGEWSPVANDHETIQDGPEEQAIIWLTLWKTCLTATLGGNWGWPLQSSFGNTWQRETKAMHGTARSV